jgi:hypothetical protein
MTDIRERRGLRRDAQLRGASGRARCVIALLFASLLASSTFAHHSAAMYDKDKSVTLTGTVSRYVWANPHVYIYIVQQQGGKTVEWEIEGSPPSILHRLGWSDSTLKVGDTVTVVGMPAKDPGRKALLPSLIERGGTALFARKTEVARLSAADGAASGSAQGIEGIWVTLFEESVDDRLDPDKMSLTNAGRTAYKHFDEKKNPAAHCVAYTAPVFMITPDLKRITQHDRTVVIESEFDAAQRTVYLDQRSHEGVGSSLQGHSIGHWEGKTLVIDTTRFAVNLVGNAYGLPSGTRKHLVERLTPSADGKTLTYAFELSDPEYMAAPVRGKVQWLYRPGTVYAPPKCDLELARHYTE